MIGSNDQPSGRHAPHSYFLIDLQESVTIVTDSGIHHFDGDAVFEVNASETYHEAVGPT